MTTTQRQSITENGITYHRYPSRVKMHGEIGQREYVDWFEDDAQAVAGFTHLMVAQGYKVLGVTIGDITIVEVE